MSELFSTTFISLLNSKSGSKSMSKFSLENGGLVCEHHQLLAQKTFRIHPKIKDFLKTLQKTDFNIESSYDKLADIKVTKPCFELMKNYIEYCSPKKFNSTKILETI